MKSKPIATGRKGNGSYVGENRKLDARLWVERSKGFVQNNRPRPTIQLQSLRACLAVIAYRGRNFRTMDVSMATSISDQLEDGVYVKLPQWIEEGNIAWGVMEPAQCLNDTVNGGSRGVRNFLKGRGGKPANYDKSDL